MDASDVGLARSYKPERGHPVLKVAAAWLQSTVASENQDLPTREEKLEESASG